LVPIEILFINAAKTYQKSLKRKGFDDESFKFKKSSHGSSTYARDIYATRPYLVHASILSFSTT
jgi:hypothetical protein